MNQYIVLCQYGSQKGCRFFFNDHIFLDTSGSAASLAESLITNFLVKGENTVSVFGGSMSYTPELLGTDIPDVDISLRSITHFGDHGKIIEQFNLVQKEDDSIIEEIDGIKKATFTFHNNTIFDFSSRFDTFTQCNATTEDFDKYYLRMKKFSKEMYDSLYSGNINNIIEKMSIRIEDDSISGYGTTDEISQMYKTSLTKIASFKPFIEYATPDHFFFAPSCNGKLWLVGIMPTVQHATTIQDAISMLPAARPKFDSDLFCTEWVEQNLTCIPCYLAFVNDKCCIVR